MKYYEAPTAEKVSFEPANVIMVSDLPDLLKTWGSMIRQVDPTQIGLYK